MTEPERVEIVIVYPGNGPEDLRRTVIIFQKSEKLAALLQDEGTLGALLRTADARRRTVREP